MSNIKPFNDGDNLIQKKLHEEIYKAINEICKHHNVTYIDIVGALESVKVSMLMEGKQ